MAKAGEVFGYAPDDPLYDMEVSGVAPQKNIPVTDAIDKGEKEIAPASPYFTKPTDSEESVQIEEKKPAEETAVESEAPKGIALTEDSLVIDYRDGKEKPFKEILAMAPLKKDYDAQVHGLQREQEALAREKQIVDANKPFLDAAVKSPFARTLLNTLAGEGISEDQAIAAAYAASGKVIPSQPVVERDPEPILPANFNSENPEHMAIAAKHMEWENRQTTTKLVEAATAPLRQQIEAMQRERETERTANEQAALKQKQITDYNQKMLGKLPNHIDFDPGTLSEAEMGQFWKKFDSAAASLGVKPDHPLSEAEIAGIAAKAFPGGKNPFTAQTQTQPVQTQTKIVIEQEKKKPLAPGSSGGTPHGGDFPVSESDRMRAILEGMATGA